LAERMSLEGRTTVITGGGRGIGLAIAEAAAEAGSSIAILDVLEKPQKDISKLGVKGKYYR
jgi:sorbose reductase